MKKIFLAAAFLLVAACTEKPFPPVSAPAPVVAPTPVAGDVLTRCAYKYSNAYNVEFLERDKVEYHPPSLPNLVVWHITDTKGRHWSINQYEWTDYSCVSTNL